MKIVTIAVVAACGLALSGCASVMRGSTEVISVRTPPADGAYCTLVNDRGTWRVMSTPGRVLVKRSRTDLQIFCTRPGFQDAQRTVPSGFQTWTLGNLVLGGVIGIGVDMGTGASNDYRGFVTVPMQPAAGAPAMRAPSSPPNS